MKMKNYLASSLLVVCGALAFAQVALAREVLGVKLDETVKVGGVDLKLNGAGVRKKAIFNVYVAGLYLKDQKKTTAEVLAAPGPKRFAMVLLRDASSETMGNSFMEGLNHNSTKAEKTKIVNQMLQFGQLFATLPELKKGDQISVDWIPGTGSVMSHNGKKLGDVFPEVVFYEALMRIWLGDQPAYPPLKQQLLGEKPVEVIVRDREG